MFKLEKSLYKEMLDYSKANPNSIYTNQDFETSGKEDSLLASGKDKLPRKVRNKKAQSLLEIMCKHLEEGNRYKELIEFIKENRLITYYSSFCRILDLYVREGLINKDKLFQVGMEFATCSNNPEEIKLGITMLGFSYDDRAMEILEILGLHSEYTLYVIESLKTHYNYNSFVFKMAKKTYGYGKIHCLKNLEPINTEIKEWIIEEGSENSVLREGSAMISVDKVDMSWYLKSRQVKEKEFAAISRLLYYIFSAKENNIYELEDSLETLRIYMEFAREYANSFEDLCAIAYVEDWTMPYFYDGEMGLIKENGWKSEEKNEIGIKCKNILKNKKWIKVLNKAIDKGEKEAEQYLFLANFIGASLEFGSFEKMLKRYPCNIEVYYYITELGDSSDVKNLIEYTKNTFPFEEIASLPENINEDDIGKDHEPDICLLYLLCSLKRYDFIEIDLALKALFARFSQCRIEAIKHLKQNKEHWNSKTVEEIKKAIDLEPNEGIKRRMKRLIGEDEKQVNKARKYVDISKEIVNPHFKDIYLFSTNVAGVLYRDMGVVEDEIQVGDILFLKREIDNPYDENAIMVTTDYGYVIGYIPKKINHQPKNLIDGGKYLYGIIKEFSMESNHLLIDVYLSYEDVVESINEVINMYGKSNINSIQ